MLDLIFCGFPLKIILYECGQKHPEKNKGHKKEKKDIMIRGQCAFLSVIVLEFCIKKEFERELTESHEKTQKHQT